MHHPPVIRLIIRRDAFAAGSHAVAEPSGSALRVSTAAAPQHSLLGLARIPCLRTLSRFCPANAACARATSYRRRLCHLGENRDVTRLRKTRRAQRLAARRLSFDPDYPAGFSEASNGECPRHHADRPRAYERQPSSPLGPEGCSAETSSTCWWSRATSLFAQTLTTMLTRLSVPVRAPWLEILDATTHEEGLLR